MDEFNVHVTSCKGAQNNHHYTSTPIKGNSSSGNSTAPDTNNEIYSATGRPIRHCVKEVGTYRDEPDIGPSEERPFEKGSHLR